MNDGNNHNYETNEINKLKDLIAKSWGNYCSSCGAHKGSDSLRLLRRIGPAVQFISECPLCGVKTVITLVPNMGMQITQLRNDISANEFDKFDSPLTSNDFLEFYKATKDIQTTDQLMKFLNK